MAEAMLDLRDVPKPRAYEELDAHLRAVLAGIDDHAAAMATMSSLIHHAFGHLWTGFYRVVGDELLRVGPYQGTLGCLEIRFGSGVCGTAARERRTVLVHDVREFAGHIVCDARARSEIVVPVLDAGGRLLAVLDVDSEHVGTFDDADRAGLERVVAWFAEQYTSPMGPGYSDRINHAFAFAAKHHDRQVRKGTKLPYLTHPANVAVILTRYGQDEDTVVAGILHDVVEDCVREGYTRQMLTERIAEKFGEDVLRTVLAVTERKLDDDGVELAWEERKSDYLERLASADQRARWICAADKIHNGSTVLADLRRTDFPESVWSRFNQGRDGTIRWYRRVYDRLAHLGFATPIMEELRGIVEQLESYQE
jgi:GAF domain-containing protein